MNKSHGKLIFRYGCMNSGKSLQLLATAHNFQEHGIQFIIFKSAIDTRDGGNVIHSRAMDDRECVSIETDDDIYKIISGYIDQELILGRKCLDWILVDECQFLAPKQVDQLAAIADNFGINIICRNSSSRNRSMDGIADCCTSWNTFPESISGGHSGNPDGNSDHDGVFIYCSGRYFRIKVFPQFS